mmetsp:Transcript_22493/g.34232  ORF Transcript_22493/g.34232 Transcript_22493/m.34232 type:complete len:485 (-) Transcript_22493:463-1917(-)
MHEEREEEHHHAQQHVDGRVFGVGERGEGEEELAGADGELVPEATVVEGLVEHAVALADAVVVEDDRRREHELLTDGLGLLLVLETQRTCVRRVQADGTTVAVERETDKERHADDVDEEGGDAECDPLTPFVAAVEAKALQRRLFLETEGAVALVLDAAEPRDGRDNHHVVAQDEEDNPRTVGVVAEVAVLVVGDVRAPEQATETRHVVGEVLCGAVELVAGEAMETSKQPDGEIDNRVEDREEENKEPAVGVGPPLVEDTLEACHLEWFEGDETDVAEDPLGLGGPWHLEHADDAETLCKVHEDEHADKGAFDAGEEEDERQWQTDAQEAEERPEHLPALGTTLATEAVVAVVAAAKASSDALDAGTVGVAFCALADERGLGDGEGVVVVVLRARLLGEALGNVERTLGGEPEAVCGDGQLHTALATDGEELDLGAGSAGHAATTEVADVADAIHHLVRSLFRDGVGRTIKAVGAACVGLVAA